jgi:hypothetical protein
MGLELSLISGHAGRKLKNRRYVELNERFAAQLMKRPHLFFLILTIVTIDRSIIA